MSPVPGEHASPPPRHWDMPMTRVSSMSRPLSDVADVAARRDEDDVVLRLTGAATIASTCIGTDVRLLEARRKVARVGPSIPAPVVRASGDDEIEACVRPRELARCERSKPAVVPRVV